MWRRPTPASRTIGPLRAIGAGTSRSRAARSGCLPASRCASRRLAWPAVSSGDRRHMRRKARRAGSLLTALSTGTPRVNANPPYSLSLRMILSEKSATFRDHALPKHIVFHDAVEGPHAVLPVDLLALLVGAAVVRNADLVDTAARVRNIGGDFRLEAEAALFDGDRLDDLPPEHLVAGLHVGQVQVGEHVREQREQAVADAVPEIEHAMRPAAHETRAEHHVRFIAQDRLD